MAGFDEFPLVTTETKVNNFEDFPEIAPEKPFLEQAKEALTSRTALQAFGATAGSVFGAPFGPAGIVGGGVAGAEAGNVLRDILFPEERPATAIESLKRAATGGEEEIEAQAIGAIVPPALKGAVKLGGQVLRKLPVAGAISRGVAPFTEAGGRARAEQRIQAAVAKPEEVAARIGEKSTLTPAQQTGERKLIELEKSVVESSADLSEAFAKRSGENIEAFKQEIELPGDIAKTTEFLKTRQQRVSNILETRKNVALDKVEQTLSELAPELRESQASTVLRGELEKALADVKVQERALWDAVPKAGIHTKGSRKAFTDLTKDLSRAQLEDIPDAAKKFLDPKSPNKFKNIESVKELQGLRSKLLEESRISRAAGNANKARIADILSDSILGDLGAQAKQLKGPVGKQLREALDFSRVVREKFNQGPVGRVLSSARTGAEKIAPEMTIQSILGAGKVKGDVGLEGILAATDAPQARQAVEQYIKGRINTIAVKEGRLKPAAAEKFIRDNLNILDKFPEVKRNISATIKQEREVQRLLGREKKLVSILNDPEKSVTTRLLKAPVEKEIDSIFRAKSPAKEAIKLRRIVSKDAEALKGLKSGTMENILNKSYEGVDEFGSEIISGKKLLREITDKRKRPAIKAILGEQRLNKLEKIASDIIKIEKSKSAKEASKIIDDTPNMIINAMATTFGARFGAKLGAGTSGASLKTASFMSNQANTFMKSLTADKAEALLIRAFTEPDGELLKALLTSTKTKTGQKKAAKLFSGWIATAGARLLIDNNEEGETDSPILNEEKPTLKPILNTIEKSIDDVKESIPIKEKPKFQKQSMVKELKGTVSDLVDNGVEPSVIKKVIKEYYDEFKNLSEGIGGGASIIREKTTRRIDIPSSTELKIRLNNLKS